MRISVPTNFDFSVIRRLRGKIYESYGSTNDLVKTYTLLPDYILPVVSMKRLGEYIKYSHEQGVKFNHILNHPGLSLNEDIINILQQLEIMKLDTITISNPQIITYTRNNLPFKICNSVVNKIDSIEKALAFRDLGCHIICLDTSRNKDFKFIELVKARTKLEVKILVNNWCLADCRYSHEHFASNRHLERHVIKCLRLKINNNVYDTSFIHPADLTQYERSGVDYIKLGGRTKPGWWIINCATAYWNRNYKGNVFFLMNTFGSENRSWPILRMLISITPCKFIRLAMRVAYFLTRKKIFLVFLGEKSVKPFLVLWLSLKNCMHMDNKGICVTNKDKRYLMELTDGILNHKGI